MYLSCFVFLKSPSFYPIHSYSYLLYTLIMNKTRHLQEISRSYTKKRPGQDKKRSVDASAHLLLGHEVCSQLIDERTLI